MGRRYACFWIPACAGMTVGTICLLLFCSIAQAAESFDNRLAKANATLKNGDPDSALTMYRDLQTEDPESEVLYHGMGCAEYKQGSALVEEKAPKDAVESFKAAQESFGKALDARDPELRRKARYDHANATAQIAMNSMSAQQYEESKKAFEDSVKEYEDLLRQYPDMTEARQNLDHVRYLLKSMLQNPPPPQEQQGGQQEKKEGQEQQQEQQQCQQGQQGEEKKDEQKEGQDNQEQKQDQPQGEAQAAMADKDQQEQKEQKAEAEEDAAPENQQNVDAILQSLEDVDKRQQKETKNARTDIRTEKDWW